MVTRSRTRVTCHGETDTQQWEVLAVTVGGASFEEGPATAVAVARTTERGDSADAHQWLVDVTLERD